MTVESGPNNRGEVEPKKLSLTEVLAGITPEDIMQKGETLFSYNQSHRETIEATITAMQEQIIKATRLVQQGSATDTTEIPANIDVFGLIARDVHDELVERIKPEQHFDIAHDGAVRDEDGKRLIDVQYRQIPGLAPIIQGRNGPQFVWMLRLTQPIGTGIADFRERQKVGENRWIIKDHPLQLVLRKAFDQQPQTQPTQPA